MQCWFLACVFPWLSQARLACTASVGLSLSLLWVVLISPIVSCIVTQWLAVRLPPQAAVQLHPTSLPRICALQICVDRYTAFRNYVLSLKDSGTNNMSLAEAAADYTRQERRQARAAARPSSVGALVAAGANTAAAGSGAYSGAKVPAGSGGSAAAAKGRQEELAVVDHSYATLIQQTRARLESRKQQEQQQQQQGQEPQTIQQQSQEPQTNQQQQQQAQVLQARALEEKQLSCSEQPPQHRQGGSTAVTAGQQQAAVCGVQRQGDSAQLAGCSGRTKQLQPSPWGSAPESAHQQQTGQLPSTILPDSDGEL